MQIVLNIEQYKLENGLENQVAKSNGESTKAKTIQETKKTRQINTISYCKDLKVVIRRLTKEEIAKYCASKKSKSSCKKRKKF